ncbi:Peptidoglycan recognition protein C, partial [Operophtera brumata]
MNRAAWGARPPRSVTRLTTAVPYVVIHHTYIPAVCVTRAQCELDMRTIKLTQRNLSDPDFPFYTRQDWGAIPPIDITPLKTPVEYVIIHHTYIPAACNTREQCSADMRSMQRYHNSLDWGDIGYNFCVGSEGGAYEGRGWRTMGIHARKANSVSVGI